MTITTSMMYWITRLDNIQCLLGIIGILGGLIILITTIGLFANYPDEEESMIYVKILKYTGIIFLISIISFVFIPTTKEMAMIYVVPKISESQIVKQDLPELYELGINALKETLKNTVKEDK